MGSPNHGRICYLEIPSNDPTAMATFYCNAFGWSIRSRGDGAIAFDDPSGAVSGAFVAGRPNSTTPGLLVYVMVDDIDEAISRVEASGGRLVQPVGMDPGELTARFADPSGNVLGLYEEPRG